MFPQMQLSMFTRLERFDVDFDLPEAFLPEFPTAIFLAAPNWATYRAADRTAQTPVQAAFSQDARGCEL